MKELAELHLPLKHRKREKKLGKDSLSQCEIIQLQVVELVKSLR